MTKSFKMFLIVIVVSVLELSFLEQWDNFSLHGPVRDLSYRRDERMAAVYADHEHPTRATKATLDAELDMMHKHLKMRREVIWGILLVIDGVGIYYLWKYGRNKTVA
jgi:hypothetical protein